ncbi:C2 calcium lipid binding region CaLB [Fasciola gigantica]|uniref:C2 calcium lipid binding region CaLB n=1 Tax=Fasciola gigantica TaxID=46835 RepID=A0A504YWU4_FASGI|nr:C2 calcium lipid binding region CaLB [Fasciola gigantica]
MEQRIPKGVRIVVRNGINLEYSVPGSKKSGKSWNWCVVFSGGKKKMATDYVEAKDGCPTWNCEVAIDLVSAADPVVLMVLDGDHRQIGQVIVPLVQIRYTDSNNFDPSRLIQADLEPTKKNSTPRGRLNFWIWATSYWPPGTKIESKSKSIKGSLSHLGGKLRSKHHKTREPDDQSSTFSYASDVNRSPRAPSMVSGAYSESNLSGNTSYMGSPVDPLGGLPPGWRGSSVVTSQLGVPGASYNPMAGMDDGHTSDIDDPRVPGRPPVYQSALNLDGVRGSYAESTSGRSGKHHTLIRKMKSKLSKSTHNLTLAVAKKAGGDKIYGDGRSSVLSVSSSKINQQYPDSTTVGINQIPSGSVLSLSRDNYPIEGGTRTSGGDHAYNMNTTGGTGVNLPVSGGGAGGGGAGGAGEFAIHGSVSSDDHYECSRPDGAVDESLAKLRGSQASGIDSAWTGDCIPKSDRKNVSKICQSVS